MNAVGRVRDVGGGSVGGIVRSMVGRRAVEDAGREDKERSSAKNKVSDFGSTEFDGEDSLSREKTSGTGVERDQSGDYVWEVSDQQFAYDVSEIRLTDSEISACFLRRDRASILANRKEEESEVEEEEQHQQRDRSFHRGDKEDLALSPSILHDEGSELDSRRLRRTKSSRTTRARRRNHPNRSSLR